MSEPADMLEIALPRGVNALALFADDEAVILRDGDGEQYRFSEWANPIRAAVLVARLRAWADLIESLNRGVAMIEALAYIFLAGVVLTLVWLHGYGTGWEAMRTRAVEAARYRAALCRAPGHRASDRALAKADAHDEFATALGATTVALERRARRTHPSTPAHTDAAEVATQEDE